MLRTKIKMGLVVLFGVAFGAFAQADDAQIGVVDMQKAIQTVEQGKKARSEVEGDFNKKKVEIQQEEEAIKKMHEEFQKQSLVMSEKARAKKQAELQERILKLQEKTAVSQTEIQRKEKDLVEPIVKRIREIIGGIAKDKGYTVILEKNENSVLYSLDKDDLTGEVISQYDKKPNG